LDILKLDDSVEVLVICNEETDRTSFISPLPRSASHQPPQNINSNLTFLTWYSATGLMAGLSRIVIQMLSRWCSSCFLNAPLVTSRCRIRWQYPISTSIGFPVPARVYRASFIGLDKSCRSRSANPNLFAATRLGIFKTWTDHSNQKLGHPCKPLRIAMQICRLPQQPGCSK
jgi:hypothetical protein